MKTVLRLWIVLAVCGIAVAQQSYVKTEPSAGANPFWGTNIANILISNVTFKGNMTFISPTVTDGPFIDELNGLGTNLFLSRSATTIPALIFLSSMASGTTNLIEVTNVAAEKLFRMWTNGSISVGGGTVGNSGIDFPGIEYAATWTSGGATRTGLRISVNNAGAPAGSRIVDMGLTSGTIALRTETSGESTMSGPLHILAAGTAAAPALEFDGVCLM